MPRTIRFEPVFRRCTSLSLVSALLPRAISAEEFRRRHGTERGLPPDPNLRRTAAGSHGWCLCANANEHAAGAVSIGGQSAASAENDNATLMDRGGCFSMLFVALKFTNRFSFSIERRRKFLFAVAVILWSLWDAIWRLRIPAISFCRPTAD